ncbi:MAG TPA: flagellar hook-basal body complex protein FliE [Devosia sp.]|nr:flagellar hook-basal body complex protein FliE [Devosia sp.]
MSVPFATAAAAYSNASKLIDRNLLPEAAAPTSNPQGLDFGKLVSEAVQSVVDSGRASDRKQVDLVNGKGNLVDVVTSVSQTQVAVQGLVAVRDRVISAYEDIMKMPI